MCVNDILSKEFEFGFKILAHGSRIYIHHHPSPNSGRYRSPAGKREAPQREVPRIGGCQTQGSAGPFVGPDVVFRVSLLDWLNQRYEVVKLKLLLQQNHRQPPLTRLRRSNVLHLLSNDRQSWVTHSLSMGRPMYQAFPVEHWSLRLCPFFQRCQCSVWWTM